MGKKEYIESFALIQELTDRVKVKLKAANFQFDTVIIEYVGENGILVSLEYTHCGGCGTDYDSEYITWEELVMEVEEFKVHRANLLKERRAKAQKEAEEASAALAEKRKAAKEAGDKAEYERLKEKFG